METVKFCSINLKQLKVADLYSLSKSTIDYALPVKESIGDLPKAALAQLETDNAAMGAQLNKTSKSAFTKALAEKDKERDQRFAEIKHTITTACISLDNAKKVAGENMKLFFDPYWKTDKTALNTETALFAEMIAKLNASDSLKQQAVTIGITAMLAGLEESNIEFDTIYKTRNAQEAANDAPSASSLKPATIKSYEQFCMAVEQTINLVSTETLLNLFNQMDELRSKYARLVAKTSNGNDAPEEPVTK
ncbi:MAG: hypothetical protein A2W90_10420 [Bacteroidetes bacterium GWF2_42_66]|nr:MAG: hypothetical protein A2W92_24115 [Bacteroidetes bacterium GWA2_42_15]OFY01495.1 MAG: hypothetical protein A2W89_02095 [Bacteroidetes bacterium GWE2_42_39]OFY43324.1 MAG: hypothetical protein A2W90_10420 [Bacteroidetes bacterium GWF2_42_66]HBL77493.1 hypothetical protein [Prolixibacteraceae bacterium]HCU61724.1 hypothetical protein [Prolixibacteraceae bacterium]